MKSRFFLVLIPCAIAFIALFTLIDFLSPKKVRAGVDPGIDTSFLLGSEVGNNGTPLFDPVPWLSEDNDDTLSVAWGDMDGDGDLDLAAGNSFAGPNKVYLNAGDGLETVASWASTESGDKTNSLAWGDMNGDGLLDLAAGNDGASNRVYLNLGTTLEMTASWVASETEITYSLAWGDMNGDGLPDLAVGNDGPNRVYLNLNGVLETTPSWTSNDSDKTRSVAWGDMNDDGLLDLAVGNENAPIKVYLNLGIILDTTPFWVSNDSDGTRSVAWGDVNGDGLPDLAAGNLVSIGEGAHNKVYMNVAGMLESSASWVSDEEDITLSVAWGDVDGDGDLDLAVGNEGNDPDNDGSNKVYMNVDGVLETTASWKFTDSNTTRSVAWGDVDGDGDLDLAVGNQNDPNLVYWNVNASLEETASWNSNLDETFHSRVTSMAWGDMDGDGDLDLAAGSMTANPLEGDNSQVYLNLGGALETTAFWTSSEKDLTRSIAWGDVDGDGDLDLAVGNGCDLANNCDLDKLYFNVNGILQTTGTPYSNDLDDTRSIAWGDMDGDGDLDLAVGNYLGPIKLYENHAGMLEKNASWFSGASDKIRSIAWGDIDGDGDLDLAVGNNGPEKVYLNIGGDLETTASWFSVDNDDTISVAWGDMDGDGDLDLAAGNQGFTDKAYLNVNGTLQMEPAWISSDSDDTRGIAWGDVDGDGDLDLAVGNADEATKVYLNMGGVLETLPASWESLDGDDTYSIAWGDVDGDGDLDLAAGVQNDHPDEPKNGFIKVYSNEHPADVLFPDIHSPALYIHTQSEVMTTFQGLTTTALAPVNFFSLAAIRDDGTIPFTYTLYHPGSEPFRSIRAFYSINGGDDWIKAFATNATITTNLSSSPYPTQTATNAHVFEWDVYASGFFGQSDHVLFRMEALPYLGTRPDSIPGPFQFPLISATTFPFRVRGTQVRVLNETISGTIPVNDAVVYRLPHGQTGSAQPFADQAGAPYKTDGEGYLQGRGTLAVSHTLFALFPVVITDAYTLYYTNISPTLSGAAGFIATPGGIQEVVVSAVHPFILFNLDVSLEWDARNDTAYLAQLQTDLQRTSEILFDWTNGQAALGDITIYHAREQWDNAHIRIYATNRLRPLAAQGGVITGTLTETIPLTSTNVITYVMGQVHMPATWNRFGEPGGNLAEDWPRTLAHEFGHYLLFLEDNYLGLDDSGQLISMTTCPGAMADQYSDDDLLGYDEFHPEKDWLSGCEDTLSNRETGRSDWETIVKFYTALLPPVVHEFPDDNFIGPNGLPLAVTQIAMIEPVPDPTTLPVPIFYLVEEGGNSYPSSGRAGAILFQGDQLIDLGGPTGTTNNQILARGASPGDQLCIFDPQQNHLGCETITATDEQLTMHSLPAWQPDLIITPVTSRTVQVSLEVSEGMTLSQPIWGRLYPSGDAAGSPKIMTLIGNMYSATFTSTQPIPLGAVHIWVEGTLSETISTYSIGGNPGFKRGSGGFKRGSGGFKRGSGAFVLSSDGQAAIVGPDKDFPKGEFYILQTATRIPAPPAWATVVGQAYRLTHSPGAPGFEDTWISIGYLNREVPDGEGDWLKVYFYNQETNKWEILPTTLDKNFNTATARTQGPGLYVLMSSIEIGLVGPGWNMTSYPIHDTRPITQALASIEGFYTRVCHYQTEDIRDHWKCFGANVPPWVNDLTEMEFADGYWIYATKTITWYLKGDGQPGMAVGSQEEKSSLMGPPATYYGTLAESNSFMPQAGMTLTAWIDGNLCGQATTFLLNGQIAYTIDVASVLDPRDLPGCGLPGKVVRFQVNGYNILSAVLWDDHQTWEELLVPGYYWYYLSIIKRP